MQSMLLGDDRDPTVDLALSEADRVDFAGGSVTVSVPGPRAPLRLFVRDEGRGIGELGFDGRRVSFSGEPIGVVEAAGDGPGGAALRIGLTGRATAAAVEALVENLVLADLSGILAARTALVTVADRHGRSRTASFALRPVEPTGLPSAPAPSRTAQPMLAAGLPQVDEDSDSFVFAGPAKP